VTIGSCCIIAVLSAAARRDLSLKVQPFIIIFAQLPTRAANHRHVTRSRPPMWTQADRHQVIIPSPAQSHSTALVDGLTFHHHAEQRSEQGASAPALGCGCAGQPTATRPHAGSSGGGKGCWSGSGSRSFSCSLAWLCFRLLVQGRTSTESEP
jgi:hypothetical protein